MSMICILKKWIIGNLRTNINRLADSRESVSLYLICYAKWKLLQLDFSGNIFS